MAKKEKKKKAHKVPSRKSNKYFNFGFRLSAYCSKLLIYTDNFEMIIASLLDSLLDVFNY